MGPGFTAAVNTPRIKGASIWAPAPADILAEDMIVMKLNGDHPYMERTGAFMSVFLVYRNGRQPCQCLQAD